MRALLLAFVMVFWVAPAIAAHDLPLARDLKAEAAVAAQAGMPLVIVFSRPDCGYCERVKRDYLAPLNVDADYRGLLVRQIDLSGDAALIDFSGEPTTHARFARAQKLHLAPVVAFFGPGGRPLAPAIVGALLPDFYWGYLKSAIGQSIAALKVSAR